MALDPGTRQRIVYEATAHAKAGQGVPVYGSTGVLRRIYDRYRSTAEWKAVLREDIAEVG